MPPTMVRPKVVRAIGYARSATNNNAFLMRQIASIRRFCTQKNYKLLAEYSDNATAGQEHSPHQSLNDMLEDMRLGNYDVVVVVRPDRLSRDYAFYQRLIREMREMGVTVEFTHDEVQGSPWD